MKRALLLAVLAVLSAGCYVAYEPPVTSPPPRPAPPPPPPPPSRPPVAVEIDFFYGALDPYGDWIRMEPYGWVWAPASVDPYWRPYTVGRWVWTDWGWTWVSNERWGWATYHYGRWMRVRRHGWVWVPGNVWGPAWVAWRQGPGVVGWAPLPPEVGFRAGVGLDYGGVDITVVLRPDSWCFVDDARMVDGDYHRHAYPVGRNATVFGTTRDATRVRVVDRRVVNEGVDRGEIERVARRAIPTRRVVDETVAEERNARIDRDEVRVYRPEVREGRPGAEPPRARPAPARPSQPPPAPVEIQREAERRVDRKWNEDWRRLQDKQDKETPRRPVEQRREENYTAAENASKELDAEKERAKRRVERGNAQGARKPAKKDETQESKKEEK
ncbi:MAG TPA: DUF6600 domain-containing protein [Candidatus Polarisedimenticolaceae bacterium]